METLVISLASNADARTIALLSKERIEYDLGWRYTPDRIKTLIADEAKNVAVARADRDLAGFGIMSYAEDHANLDLLAVKTPFQGKGVARDLVAWLEAVALGAGIRRVYVQARESNQRGLQFYARLGYRQFAQAPHYYGTESQIKLVKKLF